MPYRIEKDNGSYSVHSPHGTKGRGMTLKDAHAQVRLLNAVEHGFKPTGKKKKRAKH